MKRVFNRIVLVIVGITAVLFCLEISVRILAGSRIKGITAGDIELYRPERYRPHTALGYEMIPGIGCNRYGMHGREHDLEKRDGIFRILSLGDSVTERSEFPGCLENYLNSVNRKSFEVWHNAVGGYGMLQYKRFIELNIDKYDPDMVLLNFCLNDTRWFTVCNYRYGSRICSFKYDLSGDKSILFEKSMLYRMLFCRSIGALNLIKQEKAAEEFFKLLEETEMLVRQRKIPLIAAVYPYMKRTSEYTDEEKRDTQIIKEGAERLNIPLLDLNPHFELVAAGEKEILRRETTPDDHVHFDWDKCRDSIVYALSVFILRNGGSE
ncbi:MAG: SGNH/GDSL hydrolase family protein [Elusimicrobiota bacterium]